MHGHDEYIIQIPARVEAIVDVLHEAAPSALLSNVGLSSELA